MSWNIVYFGKEKPSLPRKIAIHSVVGTFGLGVYGIWVDFVPSATWTRWGGYLSVVTAAILTIYLYWGYGTGRMKMQEGVSKSKKALAFLGLPFFVFGVLMMVLVHGLPDIVTQIIGNHHSESAFLLKEQSYSRRSCHYQLKGEALDRAFPSYVCISNSFYDELPTEPVMTKMEGTSSVLGFHIRRIDRHGTYPAAHRDPAPAALRR